MTNNDKSKVYWAARRGMLELDIFLMPFVDNVYINLSKEEQDCFKSLIACTDMELFHWLTEKEPAPEVYNKLVNRIINYAKDRAKRKCK